jgi:hypothetical protein
VVTPLFRVNLLDVFRKEWKACAVPVRNHSACNDNRIACSKRFTARRVRSEERAGTAARNLNRRPASATKESADYKQSLRRDMIANPTSPMASNAIPSGSGVGVSGI